MKLNHLFFKTVGIIGIAGSMVTPVFASSVSVNLKQTINSQSRQQIRAEVLGTSIASRAGALKAVLLGRAAIGSGKVESKTDSALMVSKDGKTYTVNTDGKTIFRWRFWGKGNFSDIQVGDTVNVIGKWTDEAHTTVLARLVRDVSIQKRFGVFVGTVTSISGNTWGFQPAARPAQTVTVSETTKFFNRRGETIAQSDVAVGHRVRIKGLWDRANNTITQVTNVKDYNLPVRQSPTPTATPTP